MINKYLNPSKYYRGIQDVFLRILQVKYPLGKSNKKRIYLFSVPLHDNLGDQAIVYAQLEFLKNVAPNYEIKIIYEGLYDSAIEKISGRLQKDDIIAIHGGGNMGDVWENYEVERQFIVSAFASTTNKIISFPQSYNFTSTIKGDTLRNQAKNVYSKASNLLLFARESLSLKNMTNNFTVKNHIGFVPDIVLSLDKRNINISRTNIMTILRSDRELLENKTKDKILKYLNENYTNVIKSDTTTGYIPNIVSNRTRNKLLNSKWQEFSSSKIVITDRLHGMIFAYITGTPAIVFDNQNHKVRNSYNDWLNDVDYIHFADDYSNDELEKLITKYTDTSNFMGKVSGLVNDSSYAKLIDAFQLNKL
ncbi:MAG: polysaccharide pyruvyl transferase family protein [Lactobacillus sp.]|nr:polysaccharide pyruvyl transferase family protein [Lactobacillus sp.]